MNKNLDFEFNLYQKEGRKFFDLGEKVEGFVKIKPLEDLDIQEFGFYLISNTSGNFSTKEEIILTKIICKEEKLYKHETYRFPIEFINNEHESYNGNKVKITFIIRPYLVIKGANKVENKKEKYPISFWNKQQKLATKPFLDFHIQHPTFWAQRQQTILTHNSCLAIIIYSFLFLFLSSFTFMFINLQEGSFYFLIISFLIGLGFIIFISQYISNYIVGKIHLDIEDLKNGTFLIHIDKEKSWRKIHRIKAHYEVEEWNSGSTKNEKDKNTSAIHESSTHKLNYPYKDLTLLFQYPKKAPASYISKSFKINWKLKLKLESTFGLNFNFSWVFWVDKQ